MLDRKIHGYRSGLTLLLALSCLLFRSLLFAESSINLDSPYQTFNYLDVSYLTTRLYPDLNHQKPPLFLSYYLFHDEAKEPGYTLHECSFKFYFPEFRKAAATILSFGDNLSTSWQVVRQVSFMLMALLYNHNAVTQPSGTTDQSTPSHVYCYSGGSDSTCPSGHCPLVSLCKSHPCHQNDGEDNDPTPDHTYNPAEYCPKCGTDPCREAYPNNWIALLDSSYINPFESLPDTEDRIIDVVSIDMLSALTDLDVSMDFEFEPLFYEAGELIGAELIGEFSGLGTDVTYESETTESACGSEENSSHPLPLLTFLWQLVNNSQQNTVAWCGECTGGFRILNKARFAELWSANKNRNIRYEHIARAMRYLREKRKGLIGRQSERRHFQFDMNHQEILNLKSQSRSASGSPK